MSSRHLFVNILVKPFSSIKNIFSFFVCLISFKITVIKLFFVIKNVSMLNLILLNVFSFCHSGTLNYCLVFNICRKLYQIQYMSLFFAITIFTSNVVFINERNLADLLSLLSDRLSFCLFVSTIVMFSIRPDVHLSVLALFFFVHCFAPMDSLSLLKKIYLG